MKSILVTAEDSTRQLFQTLLSEGSLTSFSNVNDARVEFDKEPAELVILDIHPAPLEFCKEIRSKSSALYSVLLVCSPSQDSAEHQKILDAGADDVFLKPLIEARVKLRMMVAEKAVENWKAHRKTEESLLHAQKMDAVGRLAGGVAHDFNNWLSAILGYTDLALVKAEPNSPIRKYIEHIRSAGERATRLTSQLLTFSRKTSADIMPVDLNSVVAGMEQLTRRTIGEHIELKLKLAQNLKLFRADKAQVEQVILNLVVNARDAMPNGGKLTVETALINGENIQSAILAEPLKGEWVVLTVTDTGTGMSPEVQSHLFEPFFTTKPKGKGTGLGLSIVYGIVRHSGGHVTVSSYQGLGSTFTVCMPASSDQIQKKDTDLEQMFVPGTETLLVVEDEEMVRQMLASCLQACGYHVLEAANGAEALEICARIQTPLHLLITDSVMPKMSGKELSLRVRAKFPNIPVLLMSGHIEDESETQVPGERMEFLQKPAKPSELTRKVRDILDQKRIG